MVKRQRLSCGSEIPYGCFEVVCELLYEHDGDHVVSGESQEQRTPAGSPTHRAATYEIRWRRSEPTHG